MNIYQLPNGSFINLDALISVGFSYRGEYDTSCLCELKFALMEHSLIAWMADCYVAEDSPSRANKKKEGMMKRGEQERLKLVKAWKELRK